MKPLTKQLLSMLLAVGLLFVPLVQAQQNQVVTPPSPPTHPNSGNGGLTVPAGLSLAVVQAMQAKMVNLNNKLQKNVATANDYAMAGTALQIYFANADESGFTAAVQKYVLSNPDGIFTTMTLTQEQLEVGYAALQKTGAVVSFNEYAQSMTSASQTQREGFLATVAKSGLKAYDAQIVATFQVESAQMAKNPNLLHVGKCSAGFGAAALYMGIVGFVVGGPVGAGIALVGLVSGAISLGCE